MTVAVLTGRSGPPRPANEWPPHQVVVTAPGVLEPWPTHPPDPDLVDEPDPDWTIPERVQLAISTIRGRRHLGELLEAKVESWSESLDGGGELVASVPTSDPSYVELLCADHETWGGKRTGRPKFIDRAAHVVVDGRIEASYVLRSPSTSNDGIRALPGQAPATVFTGRIVGTGRRLDRLYGRGHFPGTGGLASLGFDWSGSSSNISWQPGVRGGRAIGIRGRGQLRVTALFHEPKAGRRERVTVRSSAFIRLPTSAEDDTTLMAMTVTHYGESAPWWPGGMGNPGAVNVDEDMPRGEWQRSPVSSFGLLPVPPYREQVTVTMWPARPVPETETFGPGWTVFDEIEVFLRDTTGSGDPVDLTDHLALLVRDAQGGRDKSTWSFGIDRGAGTGVEERLVVRHEDETPLPDAFAKVTERDDGPDPPWVTAEWKVRCEARRGRDRTDITLGPDDIVSIAWTHDPGAQASSMRGVTDRGEAYWRVASVQTNTSQTAGHVIERIRRAPNDMELMGLDQWTKASLKQVAQPQDTVRLMVTPQMGRRLRVGDSCRVVYVDGGERLDRKMRVVKRTRFAAHRLVALDVGTAEEVEL